MYGNVTSRVILTKLMGMSRPTAFDVTCLIDFIVTSTSISWNENGGGTLPEFMFRYEEDCVVGLGKN